VIRQGSLTLGNNYTITYVPASLSITARPVTVTADPQTKVYGDADPTLTYWISSGTKLSGDSFAGTLFRVAGETVAGGPYAINQGTLSLGNNYDLTFVGANLTITRRPVTVSADGQAKVYGDADPTLTYSITSGTKLSGDSFSGALTRDSGESVLGGPYVIRQGTLTLGNNYEITYVAGSLSITARSVTFTANNQSKVYGDAFAFTGAEYTVTAGSLAPGDGATLTFTSAGADKWATVAGSPYSIVPSNAQFTSGPSSNYLVAYRNGTVTIAPRQGQVAYIGQTTFVSSGSSSTTAQVTLTASVGDPDGAGDISKSTVTFKDLLTNKVLATGVKVSPVSNSDTKTGTATTTLTLSTGQYGAQEYLIEVRLNGSYTNVQQTGTVVSPVDPNSDAYKAAHADVVVMIPQTTYSTVGGASLTKLTTTAGKYADACASYSMGLKYNSKGTNPQGQIQVVLRRSDGIYYVKSNSLSSLAFTGNPAKDVTVYTKASIYKVAPDGTQTSVDGGVTLRMDAHDGGSTGSDTVGITVLSSKDSSLYYSNNWVYDSAKKAWATVPQSTTGASAVVIG
jgi:hypothetical protein